MRIKLAMKKVLILGATIFVMFLIMSSNNMINAESSLLEEDQLLQICNTKGIYGTTNNDFKYTDVCDVNDDGIIDVIDIVTLMKQPVSPGDLLGEFVINGTEDSKVSLINYIGTYSEVYVNGQEEIVRVIPKSKVLEGGFNSEGSLYECRDNTAYSVSEYAENDKKIYYFLNGELSNIYNNIDEVLAAHDLSVCILSAKITGYAIEEIYSVMQWELSYTGQINNDDVADIVECQELFSADFEVDSDNSINMMSFELVGADSIYDIEEDNVVYIYEGGVTGNIRKVAVGTEIVEGEITKIATKYESSFYYIDGIKYEVANHRFTEIERVMVEDDAMLYLDAYGDIYKLEIIESDYGYGVVLETANGEPGGLNEVLPRIRLFIQDGSSEVFEMNHFYVYGNSDLFGSESANPYNWNGALASGEVVKYLLNEDGEIEYLGSIANKRNFYDETISVNNMLDGRYLEGGAFIYYYDGNSLSDENSYGIINIEAVKEAKISSGQYYVDDENEFYINVLCISSAHQINRIYGVINGFDHIVNDGYEIEVLVDGESVTYTSDINPANMVGNGILYELEVNNDAEIIAFNAVDTDNNIFTSKLKVSSQAGLLLEADAHGSTLYIEPLDTYSLDADVIV